MQEMEFNLPTVILLIAIAVGFVFALKRAARVFGGKQDCCGTGKGCKEKGRGKDCGCDGE